MKELKDLVVGDELVSEGDNMYDALKEALELIHDLAVELEYKDAVEG